ncbi:major facilitator superfamily domain-containing protein [Delphinella strobiligena]|nr:major facilitator superfamily domain-containing protein [Delphinella strobiligena]
MAKDETLAVLDIPQEEDPHHPRHWPTWKRWGLTVIYCSLQSFVTITSTSYISAEYDIGLKFPASTQVITLGQSMFILGTAIGPIFLGPLADIGGRKWVYVVSILLYAILNIGTALAINLPMLIIFSFLIGFAGSTALSNVAGTISDLFGDRDIAGQAMALFVCSANIGPSIGSPIGAWITDNSNLSWRWIYYINIIIGGVYAFGMCFLPETLPRLVIAKAVKKGEANEREAQVAEAKVNVVNELKFVTTMTFRIMATEPIVVLLGLYNGFAYGLLFLYLDGVYDVFAINNGLSIVSADLTYLNFVVGVICMFCFIPVQTWFFRRDRERNGGVVRPEARFITSLVFVWGFPISLLWFAFTSDGTVSYWSPIVAGGFLGFCDPLLWLSMLNYITDSYPNVAASAIAAFLIPSFFIATALCHAGVAMFDNMSTKWAFATLGFISFGIVALIYVVYFFGAAIRKRSTLARSL